jgi:hypothetical protein
MWLLNYIDCPEENGLIMKQENQFFQEKLVKSGFL